ncbi:MAG: ribokinase [Candidatus Hydrogenedentota bacterium]|nr:MAG: ribokinase [Candidatus Hydrogenedentota bacterium]
MEEKRVVVVGGTNIDLVSKTRRFPRAGETVVGESFYKGYGGKGANQAFTIARLGVPISFVACVGEDDFGQEMIANARGEGIGTSHIRVVNGCSSGTALIVVDSEGQNRIVVVPGANNEVTPQDVDKAEETIARAALLVTQFEIPLKTVQRAIQVASKHGVPVLLNPAPPSDRVDSSLLKQVDILVPNETEAEALTDVSKDATDFAVTAIRNLRGKGARRVIITLGERGSMLTDSKKMWHIDAYKVHVEDTTAAGDAFVGALAAGYHFFPDLRVLTRFASAVAALAVTRKGAQSSLPSQRDVDEFLVEHDPELLATFRGMTRRRQR